MLTGGGELGSAISEVHGIRAALLGAVARQTVEWNFDGFGVDRRQEGLIVE